MSRVWRVDVMQDYHSQTVINSWHLVGPDTGDLPTQLQAWVTGMVNSHKTRSSQYINFNNLVYRQVDISGTAGALFTPTGWPAAGTGSGAELPSFCAALIKGIASGQPRPNRIRKFLCGLTEADTGVGTGSVLSASKLTALAGLITEWMTWVNGTGDLQPAAVSYKNPGTGLIEDNVGGRWNLITDFAAAPNVAVMRSRKIGHGV